MTKHFHRDLERLHGKILALSALVEEMIDLAGRALCEMDQMNREIIAELIRLMEQQPRMVAPGMHCFSATRQIERIADHATNIAEDVVYLVEGEIIRHDRSSSFAVA